MNAFVSSPRSVRQNTKSTWRYWYIYIVNKNDINRKYLIKLRPKLVLAIKNIPDAFFKAETQECFLETFFLEESDSSFVAARIDNVFIQLDEINELLR